MKIAFFGSPEAALPSLEKLLQAGHTIALIVTQPDKPAGRGKRPLPPPVKEAALRHGIPVLQPERIRKDEGALDALKKIGPDIIVVVAYGQIIPRAIIDLPRYRAVNVHFSLLPKYRGAAPVQWAILNGEEKTGVTIFELSERLDEGDILSQCETPVRPRESARELEERLSRLGADLLVRTLEAIDGMPRLPQGPAQATSAPRLQKDQGRIDWARDAVLVDRMVRAFSPWPGAFTFWRGQRIIIHGGSPLLSSSPAAEPGLVLGIKREGVLVACGSGSAYLIERLQRENRKEMAADEFLRGTRLAIGDRLG
jgi:methionyl-tRNA formyltransferase